MYTVILPFLFYIFSLHSCNNLVGDSPGGCRCVQRASLVRFSKSKVLTCCCTHFRNSSENRTSPPGLKRSLFPYRSSRETPSSRPSASKQYLLSAQTLAWCKGWIMSEVRLIYQERVLDFWWGTVIHRVEGIYNLLTMNSTPLSYQKKRWHRTREYIVGARISAQWPSIVVVIEANQDRQPRGFCRCPVDS